MMASGYIGMHPDKVEKIIMIEPGILRPDLSQEFFDSQSGPTLSVYPRLALIWLNSWRVKIANDQYAREDYVMSNFYRYMPGVGVHCDDVIPAQFQGWRASRKTLNETVIAYVNDPELLAKLDFITNAHKFSGEVLLIGTTCNSVYGAEYQKRHLSFYQNAELATIVDAGHFIFYDQPEYALNLVRNFLKTD
jgi:proline iminopeptidase